MHALVWAPELEGCQPLQPLTSVGWNSRQVVRRECSFSTAASTCQRRDAGICSGGARPPCSRLRSAHSRVSSLRPAAAVQPWPGAILQRHDGSQYFCGTVKFIATELRQLKLPACHLMLRSSTQARHQPASRAWHEPHLNGQVIVLCPCLPHR
jgi:hypothetical protein